MVSYRYNNRRLQVIFEGRGSRILYFWSCRFWSEAMTRNAGKMPSLYLTACAVVLFVFMTPVLAATQDSVLQPQALNYAGIYQLRNIDPNLTGSDIKFALICRSITYLDGEPQNDYRPNIEHNCFENSRFGLHDSNDQPADVSPHSTAICSVLLGEDPNAFSPYLGRFHYQGAAPQAQADVYEFWYFLINNVFPQSPPDADVVGIDIGNQFEDWWTRGIESMAERYGLIVVAGIGNGFDTYDPPLYPAAGSNVIGVGVVNSVKSENPAATLAQFSQVYPENSSLGPVSDNRCKPDIVTAGNCLAADVSDPNRYEPTGSFSSFSTPVVAGAVGLLIQKARQDPNLNLAVPQQGANCLIKAILLNSATKLPFWHKGRLAKDDDHQVPLDYAQGAGMLNAAGAYKNLIAGQTNPGLSAVALAKADEVSTTGWDLNLLKKDASAKNTYKIKIAEPAGKIITATAVWNRHYSSIYPFEPLPGRDADIRLELWAIDPNDPADNYLLDYSDSRVDNIEHIYTPAEPNHTDYEIVVRYSDIDDPNRVPADQRYGLAWNVGQKQGKDNIFWYDLNADGIVNELDFGVLVDNLLAGLESPERYLLGDINGDGKIDPEDLQILLNHQNLKADWYKQNPPK